MIVLEIYILLSVIMLVLYHFTKYAKQSAEQWKGKSPLRLALFYVLRSLLFHMVWPGLVAQYLYDEIGYKYRTWKYSRRLYLSRCNGVGITECNACKHQEKIISGIHHLRGNSYKLGYQCQKCGMYFQIQDPYEYKELPNCDCGGKLSRDKPVFCAECLSSNVSYQMTYIT